jgi:hypothetical protein
MARTFELGLATALSALVGNAWGSKACVAGAFFVATSAWVKPRKRDVSHLVVSHLIAGMAGQF